MGKIAEVNFNGRKADYTGIADYAGVNQDKDTYDFSSCESDCETDSDNVPHLVSALKSNLNLEDLDWSKKLSNICNDAITNDAGSINSVYSYKAESLSEMIERVIRESISKQFNKDIESQPLPEIIEKYHLKHK